MPLPTSTSVLPLARQLRLVRELEDALARAEVTGLHTLAGLLARAVALARDLEDEIQQMVEDDPDPGTRDRVLERALELSMKLGPVLNEARDLEQD